jgi:acetyl esterase/lipase
MFSRGISLLLAYLATLAWAATAAAQQPISLNDLLAMEQLPAAAISSVGRAVAFVKTDPIAGQATQGFEDEWLVGTRAFVVGADGGAREIATEGGGRYTLIRGEPWAPGGGGLLILHIAHQAFGLAHWDAATGQIHHFSPRLHSTFVTYAWMGSQLAYVALGPNGRQRAADAEILAEINRRWDATWRASEAQVTVSSTSPVFASSEPEPGRLILADPATGTTTEVARGDFVLLRASPDGRRLAAIRLGENVTDALSHTGRRGILEMFERSGQTAVARWSFDGIDVDDGEIAWSADSRQLIVGGRVLGEAEAPVRLYAIDARNGRPRSLPPPAARTAANVAGMGVEMLLPFGWIGGRPAAILAGGGEAQSGPSVGTQYEYGAPGATRSDLFAWAGDRLENLTGFARTPVNQFLTPRCAEFALVVADGALWRVAPGRERERLSPEGGPIVVAFAPNGQRAGGLDTAYHRTAGEERVSLYTLAAGGEPEQRVLRLPARTFGEPASPAALVAMSPDLGTRITRTIDGWVQRLERRVETGAPETLAVVNQQFADRAVSEPRPFSVEVSGRTVTGWLLLPPGQPEGERLPAVVSIYGGTLYGAEPPPFARTNWPFPVFSGQLLAASGYAVIYPSVPVGSGADADVIEELASYAVAAIDALAAQQIIDPAKVGIMGQSFGGFSTAAVISARSDRFQAAVSMAGAYDWLYGYANPSLTDLFSGDGRRDLAASRIVETGQIRLGQPFWRDPQPYIRNSPIFRVEAIRTPLLLLHGDLDLGLTDLGGAERFFQALALTGTEAALVHYWGEGHVIRSESAIRDQWNRITAWFGAYLNRRPSSMTDQ